MTDKPASKRTRQRRVRAWYEDLFKAIPDGVTPLEAAVSIKCIDAAGHECLINATSEGLNTWEALGMLVSASDDMRARLNSYEDED
jgi:hypothetical protein